MTRSPSADRGRTPAKMTAPKAAQKAAQKSKSRSPPATSTRKSLGAQPAPRAKSPGAEKAAIRKAREAIEDLTLWSRPLDTLRHFGAVLGDFLMGPVRAACDPQNAAITGSLAVAVLVLLVARCVPGPHLEALLSLEHSIIYTLWWFGLGVASSVGLGTGAHTGTLFLFPHICAVVRTAENHKRVDFDPTYNSWSFPPKLAEAFKPLGLDKAQTAALPEPTYWSLFFGLLYPVIVWGVGTALGELPPYLVAYSHAKAGEQDEDYDDIMKEVEQKKKAGEIDYSITGLVNTMTVWMVDFLRNNGFWGVLLFSSYPNALFDMCGLCCGHSMMPMWKFLVAVSIGKGFIKV